MVDAELTPEMEPDTTFPASEHTPGQTESRAAHARFQALERIEGLTWWDDYALLRREGWDWRKAVYIAWESSPRVNRWPANQEVLATEVLGLRSDRTIRKWREKWPELDDRIAALQAAPLMQYRRDVFDALVTVARTAEPSAHQDRKLFLEMTRDYTPRGKLDADVVTFSPSEWKAEAERRLVQVQETMAMFDGDEDSDE